MPNFLLFALERTHALLLCTVGCVLRYVHDREACALEGKRKTASRSAAYPATGRPTSSSSTAAVFLKGSTAANLNDSAVFLKVPPLPT